MAKIRVKGTEIAVYSKNDDDFICLTDIARHKNGDHTDDLIRNWIRNRNTIEFLGIWELLNNPVFKPVEFDGFRNYRVHTDAVQAKLIPPELSKKQADIVYASEADVLNMALFGMTAREWRDANPGRKGNIRDVADMAQLVCLSNLENLNAHFIHEGLAQSDRLLKLNRIAIQQMKLLAEAERVKWIGKGKG